jgi:hypothetical protein
MSPRVRDIDGARKTRRQDGSRPAVALGRMDCADFGDVLLTALRLFTGYSETAAEIRRIILPNYHRESMPPTPIQQRDEGISRSCIDTT